MILKPYTIEEHRAFLAALAEVDMDLPVAQNPNELYSKDEIRQILKCLNDRMDNDPSVKDDGSWMRMWEQIVAIADYKGIVADSDESKNNNEAKAPERNEEVSE